MTINRLIAIFFLTEILYHCYEYILEADYENCCDDRFYKLSVAGLNR